GRRIAFAHPPARHRGQARIEHHAQRRHEFAYLVQAHRQRGVVRQYRAGAGEDRAGTRAPAHHVRARGLAGDPLRLAAGHSRAAVQAAGQLDPHPGAPALHAREETDVERARLRFHQACLDRDARLAQAGEPRAVHLRKGVAHRRHHARHAGVDQRGRAGPGAAGVVAGLERDVGRGAARAHADRLQRRHLGMRSALAFVPAFAQHLVALRDHAADHRIGFGGPGTTFGQAQRARHHRVVGRAEISHASRLVSSRMDAAAPCVALRAGTPGSLRIRGPAASVASTLAALAAGLAERHHVAAAEQGQLAFTGQLALEPVELLAEVGDVLERAVHRGEAHETDVVELAQFGDHELAHAARRQFAFGGHAQLVHDRAHRRLDLFFRHRPLVQRAVHAGAQLARIEGLAPAVVLDDGRQLELDGLERAEAFAAGLALAPAPDRRAVVGRARIDDLGVLVLAEGAMHQASGLDIRDWGFGKAVTRDAASHPGYGIPDPRISTIDRELPALPRDAVAHACQHRLVLRRVEHVADPVGQVDAVLLAIAAGGDRRRTCAQARSDEGLLRIVGDRVLVDRDVRLAQRFLGRLAGNRLADHVDQHQVVLGTAGDDLVAALDDCPGHRLRVPDDLRLVG